MAKTKDPPGLKLIAQNKKARHDYTIEDTVEAGIQLVGTEVKSLRDGKANLSDAYATVRDGEAWLLQAHISPYSHGNKQNHDPVRPRKLLMHRQQIERLGEKIAREGKTLVPLRLYFKQGLAKAEIGIATGKKSYDKRQATAKRDAERQMRRQEGRRR
jgi:SsrA-binding protein